jgi:transcriptional regulator with XRE-family HTH domain
MLEQTFGERLRYLRLANGLSLAELAKTVHYSKGYLSKIENGIKQPTVQLARMCDARLGSGGELAARLTTSPTEAAVDIDWLRDGAMLIKGRRANARVPAARDGFGPDFDAGFEILRQARILARSNSPQVLLPIAMGHLRAAVQFARRAEPDRRRAALVLGAWSSEFVGWVQQERGDRATAASWTEYGLRLAEAAGDHDAFGYLATRRALILLYGHQPGAAIATMAPLTRDRRLSPQVRCLAAHREAQGHALAGDHRSSMSALDSSRGLAKGSSADHIRVNPMPPLPAGLTELVSGWCLFDLGKFEESVAGFELGFVHGMNFSARTGARFAVRRALAHAALGDIDRSCAILAAALPDIARVDSATVRTDVHAFAQAARRWHRNSSVRNLLADLSVALIGHAPDRTR